MLASRVSARRPPDGSGWIELKLELELELGDQKRLCFGRSGDLVASAPPYLQRKTADRINQAAGPGSILVASIVAEAAACITMR